jgi:metal-responsive CopG/Arc/MetJ family transcriptional regulator
MAVITIRIDLKSLDAARAVLGAKSRSEAVSMALEYVLLENFKKFLLENSGKGDFTEVDE